MSGPPEDRSASVPEATKQVSQEGRAVGAPAEHGPQATPDFTCVIGPGVVRATRVAPYVPSADDPLYRRLRIFSVDPAQPKLEGAIALLKIPFEPLEPGPVGRLFEVDNVDHERKVTYARADLDAQKALILDGRDPSPSDPQFHQQMVYAVSMSVYAAFKAALGRNVSWGFDARPDATPGPEENGRQAPLRLRLVPHAKWEKNAYYAQEEGAIRFGYYRAGADTTAKNPNGGYIFTCLSHDIIAHELSHALLDGLRGRFLCPTRPDVLAFHEGFGDLVAIFQHFAYREMLVSALRAAASAGGPELGRSQVLGSIAKQFGFTAAVGAGKGPLRTAVELDRDKPRPYDSKAEVHELGSVLVSAVFEAFATLFRRTTERYIRIATGGTGVLPEGALSPHLEQMLADEASQLASQMLRLCIRAVDYCPPVDIEFGDYLRAMITADADLVPDDPWAYREALIDAFGKRNVFPSDVRNLAEDSLRWRPPWRPIEIAGLHFAELKFAGDPGLAAGAEELTRQARALASTIADPRYVDAFGLAPVSDEFAAPCIESIRTARRVGPDGQVLFDLVAEVTQERRVDLGNGRRGTFLGGATVIVDPEGQVRYLIVKNVRSKTRLEKYCEYVSGAGSGFWSTNPAGNLVPREMLFHLVHQEQEGQESAVKREG